MEIEINIIEKMISQHRVLQKDLTEALIISNMQDANINEVCDDLKKFYIDLGEHLHLENEVFYPELLNKMKNNGIDISKTEDFINQMKGIGSVVLVFLEKYNDVSIVKDQFENFKKELAGIILVLNLRIESEESGVYGYWELYK